MFSNRLNSKFIFCSGILLLILCCLPIKVLSQTTIAFQGFEGTGADTWGFTPPFQNPATPQITVGAGNYGAGYANTGTRSMRFGGGSTTCGNGSGNCINGSSSGGGCNDNKNGTEVSFSPISIACYQNVQLSVAYRTHLLCTNQGQGFDSGDNLYFELSFNGGPFTTQATVNGANNCGWAYNAAPPCGGIANPYIFNIPPGTQSVAFRVRISVNRSDEVLYLDDVRLSGNLRETDFSYTTPVCQNDGTQLPVLEAGFFTGGGFSSTVGLTINSSTGAINPLTSTASATYIVNYSIGTTVCSSSAITINPSTITTAIYHD